MIVHLHRHHPRSPGYVSADHQDDVELSHRVGETEDRRRDESGAGQWQYDGEKQSHGLVRNVAAASRGLRPIASNAFCNSCTTNGIE